MSPISKFYLPLIFHHVFVILLALGWDLNMLEFLGLNFCLITTFWLFKVIFETLYNTWIGRLMGQGVNLRKLGSWAVVTGATDGIGLAYCVQLAKQGINIVLISRSIEKLNRCAFDLEKTCKIKTIVIEMDFTGDSHKYEGIIPTLQGLEIGTLINNVGMTYPRPTRFDEIAKKENFIRDMINMNVLAVTVITGAVLPGMVKRGKGAIINVGSFVSVFGMPYFTLYSATKAYMQQFTRDLAYEFKDTEIIFQYQFPAYVSTKIAKVKPGLAIPTPEEYAEAGMNSIGFQDETAGVMSHRIVMSFRKIVVHFRPTAERILTAELMKSYWLFAKKRELERLHGIITQSSAEHKLYE